MKKYEPMMDFSLINGSSKRGIVLTSYSELVNAFGNPLPGDGEKTQAEWVIVFTDEDGRDQWDFEWAEEAQRNQSH